MCYWFPIFPYVFPQSGLIIIKTPTEGPFPFSPFFISRCPLATKGWIILFLPSFLIVVCFVPISFCSSVASEISVPSSGKPFSPLAPFFSCSSIPGGLAEFSLIYFRLPVNLRCPSVSFLWAFRYFSSSVPWIHFGRPGCSVAFR